MGALGLGVFGDPAFFFDGDVAGGAGARTAAALPRAGAAARRGIAASGGPTT